MEATTFDPAVAIDAAPRALELALAGPEELRIDIAISVALARGHRGEREALAMLGDALRAARAAGVAFQTVRTCVNLTFLGAALRDHALVDTVAAEALALCEQYQTPIPGQVIEGFFARSLLDRGRWDDAHAAAARSARTWHGEVPLAHAIDGLIQARRGDPMRGGGSSRHSRTSASWRRDRGRDDPSGAGRGGVVGRRPLGRRCAPAGRARVAGRGPVRVTCRRAGAVGFALRP